MKKFIQTLVFAWGGDTPPEIFWALEKLNEFATKKGFTKNHLLKSTEKMEEINEDWINEISIFFEELGKK